MLPTDHSKRNFLPYFGILVLLLFSHQPFAQQNLQPKPDSVKAIVHDSVLPNLMVKVASYTSRIDHTDFMIRRKLKINPIAANLPELERKVKGFKSRLRRRGGQMNLRSLNSGVIMLKEIQEDLVDYQTILNGYSAELTKTNDEVKKILADPALNFVVTDTLLMAQLAELRVEGHSLDSLQEKTLSKVNLLRNKVSVNVLETTDIISDMRYLTMTYKMSMWKPEEPPLLKAREEDYDSALGEITGKGLYRSSRIISIYLSEKWNVLTVGILVFILLSSWTILNMYRIRRQPNAAEVLKPMHFLKRSVLVGGLMAFFTYLPFFFADPPMSFLHACEFLRLLPLMFLIHPYLTNSSKLVWLLLCALWVAYALDDILLDSALAERWGLLLAGILLLLICAKLISDRAPKFVTLPESPVTRPLVVFTMAQVVLSIIFNLTGRVSLAKIFGVSAIQCMMLGVTLKVFCAMVLEAVYLQSEAYQNSRFSEYINFKVLRERFLRGLWVIASVVWLVSLVRNLTMYDAMVRELDSFFNEVRSIGSMVFTFKSVAIFFCILWLAAVLSGIINFFFGSESTKVTSKRQKLGSMMLLIRLAIWTVGFLIAVAAAGIPLDKLSIMIGALGVGIGFGLQNIVNNLVSGVIIAFERPIQVGDLIEVGGKLGVVKEIGVRSSKINNNEGADIIIPNGDLLSQHLINWTMQDRNKQVEFAIGIPYESNIRDIRSIVQETLAANEKVMSSPGPAVVVQQFGDWSIDLRIQFWVHDLADAGSVRSNAMITIYEKLSEKGIKMPVYKPAAIPQSTADGSDGSPGVA